VYEIFAQLATLLMDGSGTVQLRWSEQFRITYLVLFMNQSLSTMLPCLITMDFLAHLIHCTAWTLNSILHMLPAIPAIPSVSMPFTCPGYSSAHVGATQFSFCHYQDPSASIYGQINWNNSHYRPRRPVGLLMERLSPVSHLSSLHSLQSPGSLQNLES